MFPFTDAVAFNMMKLSGKEKKVYHRPIQLIYIFYLLTWFANIFFYSLIGEQEIPFSKITFFAIILINLMSAPIVLITRNSMVLFKHPSRNKHSFELFLKFGKMKEVFNLYDATHRNTAVLEYSNPICRNMLRYEIYRFCINTDNTTSHMTVLNSIQRE